MKSIRNHYFWQAVSIRRLLILFLLLSYSASSSETQPAENMLASNKQHGHGSVPFLTVRNKTGSENAAEFFGGERSSLSAGYCQHSRTSLDALKPITEKIPFYIPEEILSLNSVTVIEIEQFWKNIKRSQKARPLTFYTHGFNIDFERGCRRAALFQQSYGLENQFLFFSWPSDGKIMNYTHDAADVYWSVEPMRQTLSDMLARFGKGSINVVGHSMGARGVFLALVLMAKANQAEVAADKPLFNQLIFIAPDIDAGVFLQYLALIRPLAKNITLYVSGNDRALMLSRQVHGYPRLGEPGAHLDGIKAVDIIDISDVAIRSPSGHVYHLHHYAVINDIAQLLNKNKRAEKRSNLEQVNQNYWKLH